MTHLPFLTRTAASLLSAGLAATALTAALIAANAPTDAAAPLRIEGVPHIDLTRTDGGLLPVPGVHNIEVFRASHARPDLAEGKGYTYNHHPDLAVWHGRIYLGWDSGAKDEDLWPARELYSTSENGRDWSAPAELFPQGLTTPMRLYFFHAPNGRMLAFAALRVGHKKTEEEEKTGMAVREIRANHTLGEVFLLRPRIEGTQAGDPPLYAMAGEPEFVEACRQLLAAHVTLETQDYGTLLDPADRIRWHDPQTWPNGRLGDSYWKAPSFYHRADGTLVGVGKAGWTSLSTDEGKTWSRPVIPPTLVTNNAKVWGQRTGDGRYALVYNPTVRPRYPLAIVTSDDGVVFRDMRTIQPHFTTQRYPGINKNPGLQYVRGIAEWASDGSVPDAKTALWLAYSSNKEDIWVARIPLPVGKTIAGAWSVYQPKWSTVTTSGADNVTLESREPYDCAEAGQSFEAAGAVKLSFSMTAPPAGFGGVDVDLMAADNNEAPVRLRLAGDGFLRGYERDKMVEFGHYAPGAKLNLRIEARCGGRGLYTVFVDGKKIDEAQFATPAKSFGRVVFRAWARTDADRPTTFLPTNALVGPEFDQPAATVATTVTDLKIEAAKK